ncbi:hypothetical protein CROQUDRAFT_505222 [Cronartium quercuum f. sp. fusiforme G11]|uniref:Uncharacterized protein n=1 Tax=Cronartium quercuum f. sp. fusiforme G11 TaxID=708437 RepID=A0A9P6TH09_9BASI|nr:hypothetical protein CROQUDRAFT_505222 [Cronartium quercuum f. sp. fusiforme G11]
MHLCISQLQFFRYHKNLPCHPSKGSLKKWFFFCFLVYYLDCKPILLRYTLFDVYQTSLVYSLIYVHCLIVSSLVTLDLFMPKY